MLLKLTKDQGAIDFVGSKKTLNLNREDSRFFAKNLYLNLFKYLNNFDYVQIQQGMGMTLYQK